jgi:c(7)-type cytochrome triheme protein
MNDRAGLIAVLSVLAVIAGSTALGTAGPMPQPVSDEPIILAQATGPSAANQFNRLLKRPTGEPNVQPSKDGIHDPANPGTDLLQWPSEAFAGFPKTNDGNMVDWVQTLSDGHIRPWTELEDPDAEPFVMDLVIVRQVKGSMPNVVYPHLQHTEWLDCTNCHDEIFVPEKGANQISMAGILLGQKCGICHGKVAFPISDCRRCHSQPKTADELRALSEKSNWAKQ